MCGQVWFDPWIPSGEEAQLQTSDRKFRFGDGRAVHSIGSVMLTAQPPIQKGVCDIDILTDIAPGSAPLLISLEVTRPLGAFLDIKGKEMWADKVSFPFLFPSSGHVLWQLIHRNKGWARMQPTTDSRQPIVKMGNPAGHLEPPENVCAAESMAIIPEEKSKPEISKAEVGKPHIHLGHVSGEAIWRTLKNAGKEQPLGEIKVAVAECSCDKKKFNSERPIIHANHPLKAGMCIAMDIYYPVIGTGRRHPFLSMTCALGRYTIACRLSPHRPQSIIGGLFPTWFQFLGQPKRSMGDRRTHFDGSEWGEFLNVFDLEFVMIAA